MGPALRPALRRAHTRLQRVSPSLTAIRTPLAQEVNWWLLSPVLWAPAMPLVRIIPAVSRRRVHTAARQ